MGLRPSLEEAFSEYTGRRRGIIRALTTDVGKFFALCDPEKDCMCLCGRPDGTWEVFFPPPDVASGLPQPSLGINFARDDMPRSDWLLMVAFHSDPWLMSVALYLEPQFDGRCRKHLVTLINGLPKVYEVLSKHLGLDLDGGNESKVGVKRTIDGQVKNNSKLPDEKTGEDKGDHDACGCCSGKKEFWIKCYTCDKSYHGKCVRVTPFQAKNKEKYKCPYCRCKR